MKTTVLVLVAFLTSPIFSLATDFQTHEIIPEKELLITDLGVVESPLAVYPGPLSFGHLVQELAGKDGPKDWVLDWVTLWETDQVVDAQSYMCGTQPPEGSGQRVPARPAIRERILEPWKAKDGFGGQSDEAWEINLANAPFRLLAVANRIDLGAGVVITSRERVRVQEEGSSYANSVPEMRLVFAATDQSGSPLPGGFTMIFEYGFRLATKEELSILAAYWHHLGTFGEFDDAYQTHLRNLTTFYTNRLEASGGKRLLSGLEAPNGDLLELQGPTLEAPLLGQIRTNDGVFGSPREFRQCEMGRDGLVAAPLDNTPPAIFADAKSSESLILTNFLNRHTAEIKEGKHVLPRTLQGRSRRDQIQMLAGHSQIPDNDPEFYWDLRRINDDEVRRRFSMGTCNGCHSGETQTNFFHIHPRDAGVASELSDFLQKGHVTQNPERQRTEGVSEMDQRELVFTALLNPEMRPSALRRHLRARLRQTH